jgi:hypothetical protein
VFSRIFGQFVFRIPLEDKMFNKWLLLSLITIIALVIVGCGTSPTATPAPTQPPQVVTVVITATPPPPTATPAQATLTPIPTVALTATVPTATPTAVALKPTNTPGAPKPAATKTATKIAATATATALPMKFGSPVINKPVWTENEKDEVKFYGGAIVFDWQSVGGLNGDECYLVQVRTEAVNPGPAPQSDYWIVGCGDQTPLAQSVKFTLESPIRVGSAPNYSSLILDTSQMWAHWTLSVVKNLGQCDPSYKFHCKYAPISPSSTNYFLFKGN